MKFRYLVILALFIVAAFAYFFIDLTRKPEIRILSESVSPNLELVISAEERIYGDGLFVNEERDEVWIKKNKHREDAPFLLFSGELEGMGEINARWLTNEKILIQYPAKTHVFIVNKKYLDVVVEYSPIP